GWSWRGATARPIRGRWPWSRPTTAASSRSWWARSRERGWRDRDRQRAVAGADEPAAGRTDPAAHAHRLALLLRGVLQALAAGLDALGGRARTLELRRLPPGGQRPLRRRLPSPGRLQLAPDDRPRRVDRAPPGRPLPDAGPVHPGRLRGGPGPAGDVLSLL